MTTPSSSSGSCFRDMGWRCLPLALLALACQEPLPLAERNEGGATHWPVLPEVDEAIIDRMSQDAVPGLSACIVKDGAVAWCAGYGLANTDSGLAALPETPFLLASVSKTVTAVALMQAVEDGALDLDAPVGDLLDFEVVHPADPGRPITARHLLTHTSGIADNWDVLEAYYVDGDSPLALRDFLAGYLAADGVDYDAGDNFLPAGVGARYAYSNVGTALAGHLVEAATGVPFDDWCDARIFGPLEMQAGWHLADFDPDEVAMPTVLRGGQWRSVGHFGFPDYPDGQLRADAVSTARFLAMFGNDGSLDGERILEPETVSGMRREQVPDLEPGQGLTWYRWWLDGAEVIGHNGGEVGTSTEILLREEDGVGAVVLMNGEGGWGTLSAVERVLLEAAGAL